MPKERVLVVEDDENISKLIRYNFEKAGYICQSAETGEKALAIIDREHVDLVILDIMLPRMDGFDVCKQIKSGKKTSDLPVIILTAKSEEVDRVVGFELGAGRLCGQAFQHEGTDPQSESGAEAVRAQGGQPGNNQRGAFEGRCSEAQGHRR